MSILHVLKIKRRLRKLRKMLKPKTAKQLAHERSEKAYMMDSLLHDSLTGLLEAFNKHSHATVSLGPHQSPTPVMQFKSEHDDG